MTDEKKKKEKIPTEQGTSKYTNQKVQSFVPIVPVAFSFSRNMNLFPQGDTRFDPGYLGGVAHCSASN